MIQYLKQWKLQTSIFLLKLLLGMFLVVKVLVHLQLQLAPNLSADYLFLLSVKFLKISYSLANSLKER